MHSRIALFVVLSLLGSCLCTPVRSKEEVSAELKQLSEEGLMLYDGELCLVCILGLAIVEEDAEEHAEEIAEFLAGLCTNLNTTIEQQSCELIITTFGPEAIVQLLELYNPNYICGDTLLGFCQTCSLPFVDPYPSDKATKNLAMARLVSSIMKLELLEKPRQRRKEMSEKQAKGSQDVPASVLPVVDEDGDYFSPVDNLPRTAKWRGRDCNDFASGIHPNRMDDPDGVVDNNCNAIVGLNPSTGNPYEYDWCEVDSTSTSSRRSIVMFGDSAAAAFSIPVEWLDLEDLDTFPETALQEFDHPYLSWSTGFDVDVGNDSVALQQWIRNRCNHRDFQNLGVNGAQMDDFPGYQVQSMSPSEFPLLAFVAYIGNDVCKRTLEDMTTPAEFRQYFIEGLDQLNAAALPGSKVLALGLVDGRVLWDTLYNRIHPLGCYYADFYSFLTCTDANPCETWLTSDEATRNATSLRAYELSRTMEEVVKNVTEAGTYPNLDIAYSDFPIDSIVNWMTATGKDPATLIEPVDGFHPSMFAHRIISKVVTQYLLLTNPSFLGDDNRYNMDIFNTFGNQDGY